MFEAHGKRPETIAVRVTASEKRKVTREANRRGLSQSDLLRKILESWFSELKSKEKR